jgi:AcrR family transcriptional regulator
VGAATDKTRRARRRGAPAGSDAPGRPGRKRSGAIDTAILDAVLEVLAEVGFERFTVSEVIARAGVSSATLYRRWPTLDELVIAALRSITPDPVDVDTGSLAGDLRAFLDLLGNALARREGLAATGLTGVSHPVLAELIEETFLRPRREALARILERAHARGELGPLPAGRRAQASLRDAWSFVLGPVHHRIFVRREPFTRSFLAATTTFVTAGLVARYPEPRE